MNLKRKAFVLILQLAIVCLHICKDSKIQNLICIQSKTNKNMRETRNNMFACQFEMKNKSNTLNQCDLFIYYHFFFIFFVCIHNVGPETTETDPKLQN